MHRGEPTTYPEDGLRRVTGIRPLDELFDLYREGDRGFAVMIACFFLAIFSLAAVAMVWLVMLAWWLPTGVAVLLLLVTRFLRWGARQ